MCGNGIRCFAKYVYERGIVKKEDMTVETLAGIMGPKLIVENGIVTDVCVDMGKPSFGRASIPMLGEGEATDVEIEAGGQKLTVTSLLMGVPHTIVSVDGIDEAQARRLGPVIEKHALYPRKTNVNFVQVVDRDNIRVLTWERGAELTYACGTGSCASVVAMQRKGLVNRKTTVHLKAGRLIVEYLEDGRVLMTGPAQRVFRASLIE
jgi:diaminopimelate epimerase